MQKEEKNVRTKIVEVVKSLYVIVKRIFTHPVVQVIAIILTVAFVTYYFITQYESIRNALSEIRFSITKLLWALLLTIIAAFLGCLRWWALLSWLGVKRNWIEISKYYGISTLSKYIPGFIWQYASRTLYMENFKIPIKLIGTAIAAEFVLITAVGGLISSLTFFLVPLGYKTNYLTLLILGLLLLLSLFIIFFQKIVGNLFTLFRQEKPVYQPKYYWMSIILIFTGWITMSGVYWFIVNALDIQNFSFLTAIFFNATSFTIGNLVIPIPNGLIIRETILVLLGGDIYTEISMVLSSTIFRLLIIIAESVVALLFFAISSIIRSKNRSSGDH